MDEVLNAITDLIGLASKSWEIAHGGEKAGHMVASLICQLSARYAITSMQPTRVITDMHQMTLNAMLLYCDGIEKQTGTNKDLLRHELTVLGAQYPKLELH